jgi:hypothetical protein
LHIYSFLLIEVYVPTIQRYKITVSLREGVKGNALDYKLTGLLCQWNDRLVSV